MISQGQKLDCWNNFRDIEIKKLKKVFAYDEELNVAKLDLISTSVNSLNLHFSQSASHLHTLLKVYELAPQVTPTSEPVTKSISLINTCHSFT